MINRLKAHFKVYAGHWELAGIILALVLGGVVTGYVLRGSQVRQAITGIQAAHQAEVERMQATNRATISTLTQNLADVVERQQEAAKQIDQAAKAAKSAATTAKGAAKNAAQANIRKKESPRAWVKEK